MNRPHIATLLTLGLASLSATGCLSTKPTESQVHQDAVDLYHQGLALEEQGQWRQAVPLLEQSIAVNPTPAAHYHLGRCHMELGNYESAENNLNRALEMSPSYELARNTLLQVQAAREGGAPPVDLAIAEERAPAPVEVAMAQQEEVRIELDEPAAELPETETEVVVEAEEPVIETVETEEVAVAETESRPTPAPIAGPAPGRPIQEALAARPAPSPLVEREEPPALEIEEAEPAELPEAPYEVERLPSAPELPPPVTEVPQLPPTEEEEPVAEAEEQVESEDVEVETGTEETAPNFVEEIGQDAEVAATPEEDSERLVEEAEQALSDVQTDAAEDQQTSATPGETPTMTEVRELLFPGIHGVEGGQTGAQRLRSNQLQTPEFHMVQGATHEEAQDYVNALREYRLAFEMDESRVDALLAVARLHAQLGHEEEARVAYARAEEVAPEDAEVPFQIGNYHFRRDEHAEAVPYFERSLELNPAYKNAHNNLGATLRELQRLDEAEAHLQQAVAIDPSYAPPHRNLGNVYTDMGRDADALREYREYVRLGGTATVEVQGFIEELQTRVIE